MDYQVSSGIPRMLGGPVAMLLWRYFELKDIIYECAPGILAGLAIFVIGKIIGRLFCVSKVQASGVV